MRQGHVKGDWALNPAVPHSLPFSSSLPSLWHNVPSHPYSLLTGSELWGQVALAQLLPALSTMG